jgi:hypothetical protein
VDAFEPDRAGPGFRIRVIGANFNPIGALNTVYFASREGATQASLESTGVAADPDGTWFEADVHPSAKTGPTLVTVETSNGKVSVKGPEFTVTDEKLALRMTGVSPNVITTGPRNVSLTISGVSFYPQITTLLLDGSPHPIDWGQSTTQRISAVLPEAMVSESRNIDVRLHTPGPGGGETPPQTIRVVDPIHLLGGKALSRSKVLLTFDRAVSPSQGGSRNSYSVVGQSRAIRSAQVVSGRPHQVEVEFTFNTTAERDYTVRVSEGFTSADGGEIRGSRDATFRSHGSAPQFLAQFGRQSCGADGFTDPAGITLGPDALYVVERGGNQVQIMDFEGNLEGFYGHDGTTFGYHVTGTAAGCGSKPASPSSLDAPMGSVQFNAASEILVGDTGNDRVLALGDSRARVFFDELEAPVVVLGAVTGKGVVVTDGPGRAVAIDPASGQISHRFSPTGEVGTAAGRFDFSFLGQGSPAMAAGGGNYYFVEPGNHRVQRFLHSTLAAAGSIGVGSEGFSGAASTGAAGTQPGQFTAPSGIAVDSRGNLYVTDSAGGTVAGAGRLQQFNANGAVQWSLRLPYLPGGVAVDSERGYVWVTNRTSHTVMQYNLP